MATIYGYKFNNYYNRKLKKYDTIEDYGPYNFIETSTYLNFNPNDGITTNGLEVFGSASNKYYGDCNYLIYSDDNVSITSRWFILEPVRVNEGKYRLTLRRDILADNLDKVLSADVFIEKAILPDSNPLIFNSENFGVNQIKKDERLLQDNSWGGAIVLYVDKGQAYTGTVAISNADIPAIDIGTTLEDWGYYTYTTENYLGPVDLNKTFYWVKSPWGIEGIKVSCYAKGDIFMLPKTCPAITGLEYNGVSNLMYQSVRDNFDNYGRQNINNHLKDSLSYHDETELQDFLYYSGKTIKTTDGKYYDVTILPVKSKTNDIVPSENTSLYNSLVGALTGPTSDGKWTGTATTQNFEIHYENSAYTMSVFERKDLETTYNIPTSRLHTENQPFDILAIPYNDAADIGVSVYNESDTNIGRIMNKTDAMITAMQIQVAHSTYVKDVQLIPYFPVQEIIQNAVGPNWPSFHCSSSKQYNVLETSDHVNKGFIFNVQKANFTFNIPLMEKNHVTPAPIVIDNKKMSNTCDMYRLVSPNFNGIYEFSAAKNDGVSYINVDVALKPYQPYIHLNPNFKGLYGQDWNDPTGLVCGGDFSLSQINEAWSVYQQQNKNFQNIFDRQIQNMEFNNYYQRLQQGIGAGVSALGIGATAGMIGGPIAGVAAGVASGLGGFADMAITKQLQNEAIDYTKDLFGYQLGNLKSRADSLTKVSAYNNNNKIYPILEIYSCTDTEKEAFAKKIAWNSMTVMEIGKIEDYINNTWSYGDITSKGYIKGQLIRIDIDDPHAVNAIAEELNKGVYTDEYTSSN